MALGQEAIERDEYDRAQQELEKACALFEQKQDWEGYTRTRNELGTVALRRGDAKTALEHLNAALTTAQAKLGPRTLVIVRTYRGLGATYNMMGQSSEALEFFAKALERQRAEGGGPQLEVAEILRRMGTAHSDLGNDDQAVALLEEAEAIQRATLGSAHQDLAVTLITKGSSLWGAGRFEPAKDAYEGAIAILEHQAGGAGKRILASAYLNLGNVYWSQGDYDEALGYYEKALPLHQARFGEVHPDTGLVYFNLAVLQVMTGDYDACVANAQKALGILVPALGERHQDVVQAYNVWGRALTRRGDPDKALPLLERALALQLSLAEPAYRTSSVVYATLGETYQAKGDFTRAAVQYRKAAALDQATFVERHPDLAENFVQLGNLYLDWDDEAEALRFFAKAIVANDAKAQGDNPDLAPPLETAFSEDYLLKALKGAARARTRRWEKRARPRDLEQSALVYAHASTLLERMRAGYRAEGSKLRISASASETYEEAIRTELALHRLTGDERYWEGAFRYAEKSKAGILRDALNEAEARHFAGIPAGLLDQERKLRLDLAAADRRLAEAEPGEGGEEDRLAALREKQFAQKRAYEALQARVEKEYPAYYDLKYRFDTATPAQIREGALDERSVLVEYFLGQKRIVIFTITREGLEVTEVAREASLEADLQELRQGILARDSASYARSAHRLYRQLLAPVEGRLAGQDLVIVPDGLLSTLPFEVLLEREVGPGLADAREPPYVLRHHAVSYAYSATVLLQGLRQVRPSPVDEFVGFAPVFAEGAASADAPLPLPASRKEVTDVRGLFRKRQGLFGGWLSGRSRVYLGREATESHLKAAGLERYRFVHLATHGVVDEEHPGLSRLLLAPEAGSGEDGVLHLGEVYSLRLNADLVVLSACDTGRGRLARGEGIIGLTRGFLYAGAKSLLVSLWPVSDAAAAGLLSDFYAELLGGRPKAQALREAKLRTLGRSPEHAMPYYWSSLVLVGQGR